MVILPVMVFLALSQQAAPTWAGILTKGEPMPLMHIHMAAKATQEPRVGKPHRIVAPVRHRRSWYTYRPRKGYWVYHLAHGRLHWRWER